jgi:protein-S-isoprenylcysteine O-methyltransferase
MTIWLTLTPLTGLFWAACAVMVVPEMLGSFLQRERQAARQKDGGTEGVLLTGIIGSQILAWNIAPRWTGGRIGADQAAFLLVGTVLILLGVVLRWYAIRVLGRFFTRNVAIRQDHEIVRAGPYRYVRHPSYSGYLLSVLGLGVALDNWAALAILLGLNFAVFAYRMQVEEAALAAAFGPAYEAYRHATKRVIPLLY